MPPKGKKYSIESIERETDEFIEKRAAQNRDVNARARAWSESLRSYNLGRAAQTRREWLDFHERLAATHERLASEHKSKASALHAELEH